MSTAVSGETFKPSFRWRLLGFDRREVLAFCDQVILDYDRLVQKLQQAQHELDAAREKVGQRAPTETTSQRVERIVVSAQRIADEIEIAAKGDVARLLAEANARAANVVQDAEHRSARIVEEARSKVTGFAEQVARMQARYSELRAAIERAADTATSALNEVATREQGIFQ